jgi:hypothetical protein
MGQNRRYGSDVTDLGLNEFLVRARPLSLSADEIGEGVRDAAEPLPVQAWVRFPEHAIQVRGEAVAWNDRAVWVEFRMLSGATFRAWVWASAVRAR